VFFPGGNIGDLAVNGTVNDVCMSGARPLYLTVGFILEEGFPLQDLREIVESMRSLALSIGVDIVTGDTKVVNRGKGDKIFLNTTGIGVIEGDLALSSANLVPGDRILVSGSIAEHGIAVLSRREGLSFETPVVSDTAPLHDLVAAILKAGGPAIHALRDPTRGGLAASLNEFAASSEVEIRIRQRAIPVEPGVAGACELLGLDPLYVACEGRLVAAVAADRADQVLRAMRAHPRGEGAVVIGEVTRDRPGQVSMETPIGAWRIVDLLVGEQLPRIC
jgi:hydrogenase expression/formation protein HypE